MCTSQCQVSTALRTIFAKLVSTNSERGGVTKWVVRSVIALTTGLGEGGFFNTNSTDSYPDNALHKWFQAQVL